MRGGVLFLHYDVERDPVVATAHAVGDAVIDVVGPCAWLLLLLFFAAAELGWR